MFEVRQNKVAVVAFWGGRLVPLTDELFPTTQKAQAWIEREGASIDAEVVRARIGDPGALEKAGDELVMLPVTLRRSAKIQMQLQPKLVLEGAAGDTSDEDGAGDGGVPV